MAKERHREKERKRDRKGETLNHLSIHQWVRSAIFASHQLTSPIGFPFFPTCQVRVVRFYQVSELFSSSSSASCPPPPPPLVSPRPCLHQLPPPLPPCQLFAKLFANFPAQCALGPQPGTCPAQCAPLDLKLSVHRWTSTRDRLSSVCTAGS